MAASAKIVLRYIILRACPTSSGPPPSTYSFNCRHAQLRTEEGGFVASFSLLSTAAVEMGTLEMEPVVSLDSQSKLLN